MELTILMPCLNEQETILICINKAFSFLQKNNIKGQVLIADNGSTDKTLEIIKTTKADVINVKEKGYGNALINGIKASRGKYVIMGDADDSYDFVNLEEFLLYLRQGYDLVIGNRFKGGIERGAMPFLHKLGVPFLTVLGNILYGTRIGDYHCGLRGINKKRYLKLNLNCGGMEFASEMIIKAKMSKYRIKEIPTTLKCDGRTGKPHLKTFKDGMRHVKCLFGNRW